MSHLYELSADHDVVLCPKHAKEHPAWPGKKFDWNCFDASSGECMVCDPQAHADWLEWQRSLPQTDEDTYDYLRRVFYHAQPQTGLDLFADFLEAFAATGVQTPSLIDYPGTTKMVRRAGTEIEEPATRVGPLTSGGDALQFGGRAAGEAATALADCLLSPDAAEMRAHLSRHGKV
jgi:hypothetical protein